MEINEETASENALLSQLASVEAVLWSPHADQAAIQALSDLLVAAKEASDAKWATLYIY